ncbi:ATP-binding cassette domain-containing protein [Streptomyces sp. NPDC051018]|uniref:ATP-binding cassette domain-containing protein n=1 Tax=Streptomyces sp. NPDC051018 TaxID=3365639 RepID=UPI0037B1F2DC
MEHPRTRPPAIEAAGLVKAYGKVKVLDGIDLRIEPGSVFALLGPNGAGKTTTVRILTTLTTADAGQARVAGHDVVTQRSRVRAAIGLTGQFAAIDAKQTGEENLRMMARLCGMSRGGAARRAADLLERFDLTRAARRPTSTYSGGMRRRLDLAAGLVGRPEVIFLDEPTTGLDPRSRLELWQVVREMSAGGSTVFLTTQYLEEADRLADRIALVDGGRIIVQGTAAELKATVAGHRIDLELADAPAYMRVESRLPNRFPDGRTVHRSPGDLTIGLPTDGTAAGVRALLDAVDPQRCDIVRFSLQQTTLDDVFLTLTGKGPVTDTDTPAGGSTPDGRDRPAGQDQFTGSPPNGGGRPPAGEEPAHV